MDIESKNILTATNETILGQDATITGNIRSPPNGRLENMYL